jgi:hypothetical protein
MPDNKPFPLFLVLFLLIIALAAGFFLGKKGVGQKSSSTEMPKNESIYNSQTATIYGKVTKLSGKKVTIQNNLNKQTGEFEVAESITITKVSSKQPLNATPSSDLNKIELNKDASITLDLREGKYMVTAIYITGDMPAIPANLPLPSGVKPPVSPNAIISSPSASPK